MEHFQAQLDEVALHVATAGEGRPVLLLHGFPEFWYSWRWQIPALAAAGFRVFAPDLRGYNLSGKPRGIGSYGARSLVSDIAQLIERHADGNAEIVGHDWGGVLAWRLAALRPDLVRKLAILNAPHPAAYRRMLLTNPGQWFRSLYALYFQIPGLAERTLRLRDFWLIERAFRHQPRTPDAFTSADIERYKEALRQPGALSAALNYYRAALWRSRELFSEPQQVSAPTLVVWGERDPFLSRRLTENLHRWAPDVCVERLPEASHWVQNDAPDRVNQLLIAFFRQ